MNKNVGNIDRIIRAAAAVAALIGAFVVGFTTAGGIVLTILAVLALVPLLLSSPGCASREVVTREPIAIEYWQGPPCRVHVLAGTDAPYIVRNPAGSPLACRVVEP